MTPYFRNTMLAILAAILLVAALAACASKTDVAEAPPGAQGWCEHDWQGQAGRECP